jgi:predicted RNA-binding Zn-ribbon protein involved in translation (DUF1610 family)
MATEISKPELWKFCTACDPHQERPFSVERAYIKHLSSQRHLRKTSQPLEAFKCPECGKHFSRQSEIRRHLINGRCSGTAGFGLTTGPTTTSVKKHALSVSPNEVPWKINKTAACTIDATVGLPPLSAGRVAFGHDADQIRIPPVVLHVNVAPDTPTSGVFTDDSEMEPLVFEADDVNEDVRRLPTTAPKAVVPAGMAPNSLQCDKEVDHWLSDAMKSASLKGDNLARVQVESVILSTPGASLGSLGSLFLLRSPKVLSTRYSFPSPHFPAILVRSFARSAEIPAPMLTSLVEDGLCFAETSHTSVRMGTESSTQGVSIVRPENVGQGSHLTQTASPPSGVNDHIAASTRSTKYSPSTSSYIHQLVASAPDLVFQRAREVPYNSREDFFDNGQRLLSCAGAGDALGAYTILMKKTLVDINFCGDLDTATYSSTRLTGTALMLAAGAGHHDVMYALLKASALRREYRLDLSICDRYGHTAMYLASQHVPDLIGRFGSCEGSSLPFRRFLRTLVAILCCDCPDKAHTGEECNTVGYQREDMRPELVLGLCRWCKRLSESNWPGVSDVEEINKCVRESSAPITDSKRAFLTTKDWAFLEDD